MRKFSKNTETNKKQKTKNKNKKKLKNNGSRKKDSPQGIEGTLQEVDPENIFEHYQSKYFLQQDFLDVTTKYV